MPVKLSTSHDVNLYHIKAENILLCGKIRILPVAIQPVTVIHNFSLICIAWGGVILSPGTGTA